MKQTDQGTRLPRKFLKIWCATNQRKKHGTGNMSIRQFYHNDFKKMNIYKFVTRKVKRKTRTTFLEEEKISKLVNAGDLNYLILLGNIRWQNIALSLIKRGSFKSCKKIKQQQTTIIIYVGWIGVSM